VNEYLSAAFYDGCVGEASVAAIEVAANRKLLTQVRTACTSIAPEQCHSLNADHRTVLQQKLSVGYTRLRFGGSSCDHSGGDLPLARLPEPVRRIPKKIREQRERQGEARYEKIRDFDLASEGMPPTLLFLTRGLGFFFGVPFGVEAIRRISRHYWINAVVGLSFFSLFELIAGGNGLLINLLYRFLVLLH
jgi:hypothetical protein